MNLLLLDPLQEIEDYDWYLTQIPESSALMNDSNNFRTKSIIKLSILQ